jgi:hypothetical protein
MLKTHKLLKEECQEACQEDSQEVSPEELQELVEIKDHKSMKSIDD